MQSISETNEYKPISFSLPVKKSKYKFEFQEICAELEKTYGKRIWRVPYLPYATEFKIKKAHEIAQKNGVLTFPYLLGIIRRL